MSSDGDQVLPEGGPGGQLGHEGMFPGREKPLRASESPGGTPPSGEPEPVTPGSAEGAGSPGEVEPREAQAAPPLQAPDIDAPPAPPVGRDYPMRFDVAYPERLSRLKTFFRFVLIIPVALFLYFVQGLLSAGLAAGWITVFFRRRYPAWLFQANAGALGFLARASAYGLLLTDRYPNFDRDSSPVALEFDDPPQGRLSRWRVFFWKLVLLIPHVVVLWFLGLAAAVVVFLSWWAILFTGRYPRGMFAFVTGVMRWHLRVAGYFASFNDRFPSFSLSAEAGPAEKSTAVISGIVGSLAAGGLVALIVVVAVFAGEPHTQHVDYAALRGRPGDGITERRTPPALDISRLGGHVELTLSRVDDPGNALVPILTPAKDERVVVFSWTVRNRGGAEASVGTPEARLQVEVGGRRTRYEAELVTVDGRAAPGDVPGGSIGTVRAVFIVPAAAQPVDLRFTPDFVPFGGVRYVFD